MTGLDIVVTNYNTRELLTACLESLHAHQPQIPVRITVVDNGSTDGSAALVRERFPAVRLAALPANCGYGSATNHALRELEYEQVLLLNADTRVTPGSLDALCTALADDPRAGVLGPRQIDGEGRFQLSCGASLTLPRETRRWLRHRRLRRDNAVTRRTLERHYSNGARIDWLSGAALLIRREALRRAGLFDERFFLYFEDIDLCLRIRQAGFTVRYVPAAAIVHHGGCSAAQTPGLAEYEYRRSQLLFWAKHGDRFSRSLIRSWVGLRSLSLWLGLRSGALPPGDPHRLTNQRRLLRLAWEGVR